MEITRRYHFAASHRLHAPSLSDVANAELFGKCNNPFGHGHNYVLSVTATGKVDPRTGLIVNIERLDRFVEEHILQNFASRNLNQDLPQFADLVPTTENVAVVIASLLEAPWPAWFSEAHLSRIYVQETERNGFQIDVVARKNHPAARRSSETVTVNV